MCACVSVFALEMNEYWGYSCAGIITRTGKLSSCQLSQFTHLFQSIANDEEAFAGQDLLLHSH